MGAEAALEEHERRSDSKRKEELSIGSNRWGSREKERYREDERERNRMGDIMRYRVRMKYER